MAFPEQLAVTRRQILVGAAIGASSGLFGCRGTPRERDLSSLSLPQLPGLTRRGAPVSGLANGELKHGVTVLVSWSSTCGACQANHSFLLTNQEARRYVMAGVVNYDSADRARRYLENRGNPYDFVAFDDNSRLLRLTGVTAVPTTYIVDSSAIVRQVFVGNFTRDRHEREFLPALRKLIDV
jgi:cytochrome c biogenesis protein CcmG, thiol:disulfide interchange protein DsbE